MIKEAYVSFEVARLLKEKGFNELCNRVYEGPNLKYATIPISPLMSLGELRGELGGFHPKQLYATNNELGDIVYTAPTQQMAMAYLREVHNVLIVIDVRSGTGQESIYCWQLEDIRTGDYICDIVGECSTYEQACEAALKYYLEILI